jgi:hypothetical protein
MSHPGLLKKAPKPGVQGSPCRGLGCPQKTLFSLFARRLRRREGEKKFLGTPQTPVEGDCPLHSRLQNGFGVHNRLPKNSG